MLWVGFFFLPVNCHLKTEISIIAGICLRFSHDLLAGRIPGMSHSHSGFLFVGRYATQGWCEKHVRAGRKGNDANVRDVRNEGEAVRRFIPRRRARWALRSFSLILMAQVIDTIQLCLVTANAEVEQRKWCKRICRNLD